MEQIAIAVASELGRRAYQYATDRLQTTTEQAQAAAVDWVTDTATQWWNGRRDTAQRRRSQLTSEEMPPIRRQRAADGRFARPTTNRFWSMHLHNRFRDKKRRPYRTIPGIFKGKRRYTAKRGGVRKYKKKSYFARATRLYNRKSKGVRRYNKGPLQLAMRMSTGGTLPYDTRISLYTRMEKNLTFNNHPGENKTRTWKMSSLFRPWANVPGSGVAAEWLALVRQLYKKYLVTGAKLTVEVKPTFWQQAVVRASEDLVQDMTVPLQVGEGYWYLRLYYKRDNMEIGHYMGMPFTGMNHDNVGTENVWKTKAEFLADPTVNWKKDTTVIRQRTQVCSHEENTALVLPNHGTEAPLYPNKTINYEIESSRKIIRLSQTFSYKKHFMDNNYMKNATFKSLVPDIEDAEKQFLVRLGYIAFKQGYAGTTAFHVPIDRNNVREVTWNMQQNVRLREPSYGPDGVLSRSAITEIERLIPELQQETQKTTTIEWEKAETDQLGTDAEESACQTDDGEEDSSSTEDSE